MFVRLLPSFLNDFDGMIILQPLQICTCICGFFNSLLDGRRAQSIREINRLAPLVKKARSDMQAKEKLRQSAWKEFLRNTLKKEYERASNAAVAIAHQASNYYFKLDAEMSYYMTGDFYFEDLPKKMTAVKTNSDGLFSMKVPSDESFAIGARAERLTGSKIERYFWLIELSMDGNARKTIMLSNDNLASTLSCMNSLIRIIDL